MYLNQNDQIWRKKKHKNGKIVPTSIFNFKVDDFSLEKKMCSSFKNKLSPKNNFKQKMQVLEIWEIFQLVLKMSLYKNHRVHNY